MKKIVIFSLAAWAALACSCNQKLPYNPPVVPVEPDVPVLTYAKGADVSWLTLMENKNYTFKNAAGEETECMKLLRDECGVNAVRLRVWVNPADGWCNSEDVLLKARRAKALGLAVMIDFHLSDVWADPLHQEVPAAWEGHTLEELKQDVREHIVSVLGKLKAVGVKPQWVQVGNETHGGMLYDLGKVENGSNFASLVNAGHAAVKEVFPDAKTIVHIDGGQTWANYTRIYGYLKTQDATYDMIGVSFYPAGPSDEGGSDDLTSTDALIANLKQAATEYGKPVMVCEIGMHVDDGEFCKKVLTRIMQELPAGSELQGIFYWEPQAPGGFNGGYRKGCFKNGRPTQALDPFKE